MAAWQNAEVLQQLLNSTGNGTNYENQAQGAVTSKKINSEHCDADF